MMRPSTASDADPLRRPLLVAPSDEREERSSHPGNPSEEGTETEERPEEEPSPTSEGETDDALLCQGMLRWSDAHTRPALQRQYAACGKELYDTQKTTCPFDNEQRGGISTGREHNPLSEEQGRYVLGKSTPNTAASHKPRLSSSGHRESPLPTVSPATAVLGEHDRLSVKDVPKERVKAVSRLPLEGNQTRTIVPFSAPPLTALSPFSVTYGDTERQRSRSRWSSLMHFCQACVAGAWRGCCGVLTLCRDCNRALCWLLSPLLLLFTWFCWHGVRAVWKVGSEAPDHWAWPDGNGILEDYGLVIDAGSHGSRLSIFSWKPRVYDPTHPLTGPISFPKLRFRGMTTAALNTPYEVAKVLSELIDQGTDFLHFRAQAPELRWGEFPLYLKATGGIRNMEQTPRDKLMETIRDYLQNREHNPFRFERAWARVLAGEEEGVYGWLAVNSGRNSLLDDPARTTGALDLGGASAQITFVPTHTSVLEDLTLVRLGDRTIRLYSHSYLGYGWGDALSRVSTGLAIDALLQHVKANPRFVAENIVVGWRRVNKYVQDISSHDHSTFSASARSESSRTSQVQADLHRGISRAARQNQEVVGDRLARTDGRVKEVRRQSLTTGKKRGDDGVTAKRRKKGNGAKAKKILRTQTRRLSGEKQTGGSNAGKKRRNSHTKQVHNGKRQKEVKQKKRTGNKQRQHQATASPGERLYEKDAGLVSTAPTQSPGSHQARGRDTETPAFLPLEETTRNPKEQNSTPENQVDGEEETSVSRGSPQGADALRGIDAKDKQMRSGDSAKRGSQKETLAATRQFFLKETEGRSNAGLDRASSEDTAAAAQNGIQQQQHAGSATHSKRHDTAAETGTESGTNGKRPATQQHHELEKRRKSVDRTLSEQRPEGRAEEGGEEGRDREREEESGSGAEEAKNAIEMATDGPGSAVDEKTTQKGTQGASHETDGGVLTFTVNHPCFPQGSVYEFPLPPFSYPERRYYADISVDKIAEYVRIAGYDVRHIENTREAMVFEAGRWEHAKRHRAKQPPPTPEDGTQQQQGRRDKSTGEIDRELSAADGLPHGKHSVETVSGASVPAVEGRQQQQQAGVGRLSEVEGDSTTVDTVNDEGENSNKEGKEKNTAAFAARVDNVFPRDFLHQLLSASSSEEAAQMSKNAGTSAFAAAGGGGGTAKESAAADTEHVTKREELANAAAAADSPWLWQLLKEKYWPLERSGFTSEKAGTTSLAKPERQQQRRDSSERRADGKDRAAERDKDKRQTASGRKGEADSNSEAAREPASFKMRPTIRIVARFVGTGDLKACQAEANKLFHHTLCFVNDCSFNGVYQPRLENSNFLAFGQYSKVHAAMKLPPNAPLSSLLEGAWKICGQRLEQLHFRRRLDGSSTLLYSKKSLEKLCWKTVWSYAMLHEGFGFPDSSARISFAPLADNNTEGEGPAPEWAAGSMIVEVNSYPWEAPPVTYEVPLHFATAFLLMSMILAIILYHEVSWMRKRLREDASSREREESVVGGGPLSMENRGSSSRSGREQEMQQVGGQVV